MIFAQTKLQFQIVSAAPIMFYNVCVECGCINFEEVTINWLVITIDLAFKTRKLNRILVYYKKIALVQCTFRHSVVSISIDIDRLVCGSPFDN